MNVRTRNYSIGGAANAALNVSALGAGASIISCIGKDLTGKKLTLLLKKNKINTNHIIDNDYMKTTLKTRVVSEQHHQQLLRIDEEDCNPVSKEIEKEVISSIIAEANNSDALLISDYSKGLITENIANMAVDSFKLKNKPIVVDSKAFKLARFRGATIFTPNIIEAQDASGVRIVNDSDIINIGKKLLSQTKSKAILITLGDKGCALFEKGKSPYFVDSFASEVFDVTGAGDTVASLLTIALAAGMEINKAVFLANVAASVTVRHFGSVAPSKKEILEALSAII